MISKKNIDQQFESRRAHAWSPMPSQSSLCTQSRPAPLAARMRSLKMPQTSSHFPSWKTGDCKAQFGISSCLKTYLKLPQPDDCSCMPSSVLTGKERSKSCLLMQIWIRRDNRGWLWTSFQEAELYWRIHHWQIEELCWANVTWSESTIEDRDTLGRRYKEQGLQRHVEAVLLVHRHNHPHVLLLQTESGSYKLPGGYLKPGEDGTSSHKSHSCSQNTCTLEDVQDAYQIFIWGNKGPQRLVFRSSRIILCWKWRATQNVVYDEVRLDESYVHITKLEAVRKVLGNSIQDRQGQDVSAEAEGLRQRLVDQLSPEAASLATEWLIGDCIATYWRPHFEAQTYPYLPVHITRPKETRKLFSVYLPERCYFAVSHSALRRETLQCNARHVHDFANALHFETHIEAVKTQAGRNLDEAYDRTDFKAWLAGLIFEEDLFYRIVTKEHLFVQVPKNYKLVAIPLYDCYEGNSKFGPTIATLPHLLSRYRMTFIDD